MRRPDATICLASAFAHHDLAEEIPAAWTPRSRTAHGLGPAAGVAIT